MIECAMYTTVEYAGRLFPNINDAIKDLINTSNWYYAKIFDEDGNVIFEDRRPYFVRNCRPLKDSYTGEIFMASKCFRDKAEAELYGEVIELRERLDYFKLNNF